MNEQIRQSLAMGLVIPAHPLALDADGRFDERHQRALTRYYIAAGAGGLAVGVHTTQFAIREAAIGLFEPVLSLARDEMDRADRGQLIPLVRIGGICGPTAQAVQEATLLAGFGYHAGLLSLAALRDASDDELIAHCRRVSEVVPLVGFYLQPAVGGRPLGYAFWRRFAEIERVMAIKIAPFNRYQTLDVIRAVVDAGTRRHRDLHRQRRPYRRRPRDSRIACRRPTGPWSGASSAACSGIGRSGPSARSHCLPNAMRCPRARRARRTAAQGRRGHRLQRRGV